MTSESNLVTAFRFSKLKSLLRHFFQTPLTAALLKLELCYLEKTSNNNFKTTKKANCTFFNFLFLSQFFAVLLFIHFIILRNKLVETKAKKKHKILVEMKLK